MTLRDLRVFRYRLHRECRRKYRFYAREDAEAMAAQYRQRAYQCTQCGYYHLTKARAR